MKTANEVAKKWFVDQNYPESSEELKSLSRLLAQAHAAGRADGIEEAVKMVLGRTGDDGTCVCPGCDQFAALADEIRNLAKAG